MRSFIFLFLFGAIVIGCSQSVEQPEPMCSQVGFLDTQTPMELQSAQIDSVQFSDGIFRYSLTGNCRIGQNDETFSVLLDKHPLRMEEGQVLSSVLPLSDYSASDFTCCVNCSENELIVQWKRESMYLKFRIDKKLIARH